MSRTNDLFSLASMSNGLQFGKKKNSVKNTNQLSLFREEATGWKDRFVDSEFKTNPGVILLKRLSGTFSQNQFPSCSIIGLTCKNIINIIEDTGRINYVAASKLGSILKTSTQYWLDIQSRYEAKRFLKTYAIKGDFIFCTLNKYIKIVDQRSDHFQLQQGCCHPGEILVKEFLEPLGLASQDWRNLLMLSTSSLTGLIKGRNGMSFQLIVTLCKIFKTQAHFWMDIQNSFYASMGEQQLFKKPV